MLGLSGGGNNRGVQEFGVKGNLVIWGMFKHPLNASLST